MEPELPCSPSDPQTAGFSRSHTVWCCQHQMVLEEPGQWIGEPPMETEGEWWKKQDVPVIIVEKTG